TRVAGSSGYLVILAGRKKRREKTQHASSYRTAFQARARSRPMIRARVLGIPHVEHGEIVFAVWVQGTDRTPEVVQVSTGEPNNVFVDSHGHDDEVVMA